MTDIHTHLEVIPGFISSYAVASRSLYCLLSCGGEDGARERDGKWVSWPNAIRVKLSQTSISITWLFGLGLRCRGLQKTPRRFGERDGGRGGGGLLLNREGNAELDFRSGLI